ncbi:MAG TPA: TVP38/TMEM64 family protein [Thermomicrobiales bacterium]|nr:TVP38/TMEM64 family protein [Thermomicrobiales bacterium]
MAVASHPSQRTGPVFQRTDRHASSPRLARLMTRRAQLVILGTALAVMLLAWLTIPALRTEVAHGFSVVTTGDQDQIGAYLRSFGVWGPVISLVLMIAQAIIAPIPGALIVFANGIAFGTFQGTVLSVAGQTLAAALCFGIARTVGRGPVERMVGRFGLETLDRGVGRWGPLAIVALRLVPGVAFDAISYGAGLLRMRFRVFLLATVAGIIPQTLFYTWMVRHYPQLTWMFVLVAIIVFLVVALGGAALSLRRRRASRISAP